MISHFEYNLIIIANAPENVKVAVRICNLYDDNEFHGTWRMGEGALGYHSYTDITTPIFHRDRIVCVTERVIE